MKRACKVLGLMLSLLFLSSTTAFFGLAVANPSVTLPNVTIKSDGTLEPQTDFIKRDGNMYILTREVLSEYTLVVQCSDIVLDGLGHAINGSSPYGGYSNIGLSLDGVRNVTVKNLVVVGFIGYAGILLSGCSECFINNITIMGVFDLSDSRSVKIFDSRIDGTLGLGVNNQICQSNITTINFSSNSKVTECDVNEIIMFEGCSSNTILRNILNGKNNFIGSSERNFWDNGSIGNYWSDYFSKYPDAADGNNSGVGNKPYVMNTGNIDNYPLMKPFVMQEATSTTPSSLLSMEPHLESSNETFSIALILGSIAVSIAAIVICLIYYRRKRRG